MKGATIATAAATIVLTGLALIAMHARRQAEAERDAARRQRTALATRIVEEETKIARAERLAKEAEGDTTDLLKAVAALEQKPPASSATASPLARPVGEGATVIGSNPNFTPEENERLAMERAYQQDLAKRRQQEVKRRAEVDMAASGVDPARAFSLRLAAVQKLVDEAQFQAAQRLWNEAMAAKPPDLPLSDEAKALQAALQAQSQLVEVKFISDSATYVSIAGTRNLNRFAVTTAKLLPGDYEVFGRRPGYQSVTMMLQVRSGVVPPDVTVICTQPVGK